MKHFYTAILLFLVFTCFYLFLGTLQPSVYGASRGSSTTNFWLNDDKFLVERRQISG